MEAESLQEVHEQVLALQNALQAGGVGYWQINCDDSIEGDPLARRLLGLQEAERLNDLTDFLIRINPTQQEDFLDALDEARTKRRGLELTLELAKTPLGGAAGFSKTSSPTRLNSLAPARAPRSPCLFRMGVSPAALVSGSLGSKIRELASILTTTTCFLISFRGLTPATNTRAPA